jgi:aminoglycoside phosphotransferase (APT) family kinase protein
VLREIAESLGLPRDVVIEPVSGGASGSAWRATTGTARYVIRIDGSPRLVDSRHAAMDGARAAGLPAPAIVARAATRHGEVLLLKWLSGVSMIDALRHDPESAEAWGRRAGALHRNLHAIRAPSRVLDVITNGGHPFVAGGSVRGLASASALLHLDWHPGNLLVDERGGSISGIIDWDNARAGHPLLDVARTTAMLEADPAVVALAAEERARLEAFRHGWAAGYGPDAIDIPPACLAWAGRVMLADLENRYADVPGALDRLRAWTAEQEA